MKFLEEKSPVREFCTPKPMNNVLSKTYMIEHDEGTAYQVVGNAEVPRAEDVSTQFTVFLHRNATGYKIDDDQRRINSDDPGYEARKMRRAMERLLKKENKDILDVMMKIWNFEHQQYIERIEYLESKENKYKMS